jgi:hypothetical protein
MKVLALIYGDESRWDGLDEQERKDVYDRYRAFAAVSAAKIVGGAELAPTSAATTVRTRDGENVVTDGPFAETKEALGGFFVLDCSDLDEAAQLAAQIPGAATGAIELRAAHEEEAA